MAKRKRKKPGFWSALRLAIVAAVAEALEPKVVANAKSTWVDGENLAPRIQPYPWRHYVAPEHLEIYAVNIGGQNFEIELLPEHPESLEKAAYDAAVELWGPYLDSQPLLEIRALNEAALAVLPIPIHG